MGTGLHAKAITIALRGDPEHWRSKAHRVLFTAADTRPEVAKRVALHAARSTLHPFRRWATWFWPLYHELADDDVGASDPLPPEVNAPGLSLFVGGVLDLRTGYRRGTMFAEFAERVADGLLQLALAGPVATFGRRDPARWRAACQLADDGDFEPLESLLVRALHEDTVLEEMAANLRRYAHAFDVGAADGPGAAEIFLRSDERRAAEREPPRRQLVDNVEK